MDTQQDIKRAFLELGYIGADGRFYSNYSLNDIAQVVMGIHPIHDHQVMERIQRDAGLDNTLMQYGNPLTGEQVEQVASLFAHSGFAMRLVTLECTICGVSFEQFPHPITERTKVYTYPQCRARVHKQPGESPLDM